MNASGKIAVILPELIDPLDIELLQGIQEQASAFGLDVLVLTGIFNSQVEFQQDDYTHALENIYSLVCKAELDGILFCADRFHNQPLIQQIYEYLSQTKIPCLVLGEESETMPFLHARQKESMYQITKHLIEEHHCQKLYCITGIPRSYPSKQRLAGFCQAMQEAGLEVPESSIFYGYFWKDIPKQIAEQIADGTLNRPDAVVCASDVMAISLTETLREQGIRVPEDIAVTGYDGSWAALMYSVTTVSGRDAQFGADAVCRLYELMTGTAQNLSRKKQYLRYGTSCGCGIQKPYEQSIENYMLEQHIKIQIQHKIQNKQFIAINCLERITAGSDAMTLKKISHNIGQTAHVLSGWKKLDICLCEDWKFNFENPEHFRETGYSENMYLLLSKSRTEDETAHNMFPVRQMTPRLQQPHKPVLAVFTSLHFRRQIFGYIAAVYEKAEDIELDNYFVNWCNAVANGLNQLQNQEYQTYIYQQMELLSIRDPSTGLLNRRGFAEHLPEFLHQCRKKKQIPVLLLLTGNETLPSGYDMALLLANALRDATPECSVSARIQEKIFAVLFSVARYQENCAESILHKTEKELCHLMGNLLSFRLVTLVQSLKSDTLNQTEAEINTAVLALQEKNKIYAEYDADYKESLYRLRRNLQTFSQKNWNIPDIAKEIGISRSHLQKLYKELFNVSIWEDLISIRISKAQQLLLHTGMKISEIALSCGYQTEAHFMRQFKKKTGLTPSEYRKKQIK